MYCIISRVKSTYYIIKKNIHSSCDIEAFVETHLCKLCAIRRSRVLLGVFPHQVFFFHTFTFQLLDKPWSQLSSLLPPRFLPSIFIAHRVQQSHCSSNFDRVLLTHALALSGSQFVHKKKSQRIYKSTLGGARTHETDLYQARGHPNTPPGRPVRNLYRSATRLGTTAV